MSDDSKLTHQVIYYKNGDFPKSQYGDLNNVEASLVCFHGPGIYTEPDKNTVEQLEATITNWANQLGFPETYSKKYEPVYKSGASSSIYVAPILEYNSIQAVALGKLFSWMFLIDDVLDEMTRSSSRLEQNTYANVCSDLNIFTRIFNGELDIGTDKEELPSQKSTLIHYEVTARIAQDVYACLVEAIPSYQKNKKYFVKSIRDFLVAFLWRYRRFDNHLVSESTYMYFRRHHGFCFAIFESIALIHGVEWTELKHLRSNIEFKNYRIAVASSLAIANDVLSLRKEIADNEYENLILQKHFQTGVKVETTLDLAINDANYEVNEAKIYAGRIVEQISPTNEMLKKLIQVEGLAIDGSLHFYYYSKRYGAMERQVKQISEIEYYKLIYRKFEDNVLVTPPARRPRIKSLDEGFD